MADEAKTASAAAAEAQPQAQAQQVEVKVDEAGMTSAYTNWYRVTGTPEELIIDFGLNPQMGQLPTMPIKVTDRLVMNFYTAKRLLNALHYAVSRHENFFGALEVDIQRRLRAQALAQQQRPAGSSGFAQ